MADEHDGLHPPTASAPKPESLAGINGWLLIPAIGLLLGPLFTGFGIMLLASVGSSISAQLEADSPGYSRFVAWEIGLSACLLLLQVLLAVAFFLRKRSVPRLMVCFLLLNLMLTIVNALLAWNVFGELSREFINDIIRATMLALVWIPYFLLSRRVKATFDRGKQHDKTPWALSASNETPHDNRSTSSTPRAFSGGFFILLLALALAVFPQLLSTALVCVASASVIALGILVLVCGPSSSGRSATAVFGVALSLCTLAFALGIQHFQAEANESLQIIYAREMEDSPSTPGTTAHDIELMLASLESEPSTERVEPRIDELGEAIVLQLGGDDQYERERAHLLSSGWIPFIGAYFDLIDAIWVSQAASRIYSARGRQQDFQLAAEYLCPTSTDTHFTSANTRFLDVVRAAVPGTLPVWSYSLIAGLAIGLVYAPAMWLAIQCRKHGTLLPRGGLAERWGALFSVLLYAICGSGLIAAGFYVKTWVALTIVVAWVFGSRLAMYLERVLYARTCLDDFEVLANRYLERYQEQALVAWNMGVPRWWISMMSSSWEQEYRNRVGAILKSTDPRDPLFDLTSFLSGLRGGKA